MVVNHSALVHIMNSKKELPTLRIKKMLEILSQYNFSICHLKGKEMYISDFLSRHPGNDTLSPNEIIPIVFILDNWLEYHEEMEEIPVEYILHCLITL